MSSFRIEESQLREWHGAAAQRTDVRGVAAVAKELEAHLARKDVDGTIVVSRHQLFTWAEALQGAAARSTDTRLQGAVDDMRSVLTGKAAPPSTTVAPLSAGPSASPAPAVAPGPMSHQPPPSVTYSAMPGAATAIAARGNAAFVPPTDVAIAVRELLRGATSEVRIIAPWATGIETLVAEIALLAPSVRVLIVSRRPEREDAAYHQAMDQLGRRRAITAFSSLLQTRMVIQDSTRALVGAASFPAQQISRESAVLLTDAASVAAAQAHFEKVFAEAGGARV